jgi:hypothetical protein
MWTYHSETGLLEHNGVTLGRGYSGHGEGLNNSAFEAVHDVGPIPRGLWSIGSFYTDSEKGPLACILEDKKAVTFGRSGFMIHGDNPEADHSASHGCIILSRPLRQMIAESGDTSLEVV